RLLALARRRHLQEARLGAPGLVAAQGVLLLGRDVGYRTTGGAPRRARLPRSRGRLTRKIPSESRKPPAAWPVCCRRLFGAPRRAAVTQGRSVFADCLPGFSPGLKPGKRGNPLVCQVGTANGPGTALSQSQSHRAEKRP